MAYHFKEILDPGPTELPGSGTLGQRKLCPAWNCLSLSGLLLTLAGLRIQIPSTVDPDPVALDPVDSDLADADLVDPDKI